jgi:hypothetical protein
MPAKFLRKGASVSPHLLIFTGLTRPEKDSGRCNQNTTFAQYAPLLPTAKQRSRYAENTQKRLKRGKLKKNSAGSYKNTAANAQYVSIFF